MVLGGVGVNKPVDGSTQRLELRAIAEACLERQTAPPTTGSLMGIDALALLYGLASTPDRAADALKLLHELQVHQVELDLLHGELEARERAMADDLARYKGAYEFAPFSCFIVNFDGVILEANLAGARLVGVERNEIPGRAMEGVVDPQSRPALEELLQQFRDGREEASCEVQSFVGGAETRGAPMRISGRLLPDRASILIAVAD